MDHEMTDPPRHLSGTAWMVTFADLASLLLAFFVLLFAMSDVQTDEWQAVVETLSNRLSPDDARDGSAQQAPDTVRWLVKPKRENLEYLASVLEAKISADPTLSRGMIQRFEDRMVVSIPAASLFEPGSTDLTPAATRTTLLIGELLSVVDSRIEVGGHGGRAAEPSSAWRFTLERALAVAATLRRAGLAQRIAALGFADSRGDDLSAALPSEQRRELAERIEIVVHDASVVGESR